MPNDAKPLNNWLQQQPATVGRLLTRAQRLSQINCALKEQWADEPWIHLIRVANIRGSTVVIYVQTASAIIPLRYRREALLAFLKQRFELVCLEMDAKVKPLS